MENYLYDRIKALFPGCTNLDELPVFYTNTGSTSSRGYLDLPSDTYWGILWRSMVLAEHEQGLGIDSVDVGRDGDAVVVTVTMVQSTYSHVHSLLQRSRFLDVLFGRRSRRFYRGGEIPDGVFQYKSKHPVLPLDEVETLVVLAACTGSTGCHYMIPRGEYTAQHLSLPNYASSAGGRTFPSAAGFHTSNVFFTNDNGVFVIDNRHSVDFPDRGDLDQIVTNLKSKIVQVSDVRLDLAKSSIEAHNKWIANKPGSLFVIPVADVSLHALLTLCYLLQNNMVITDDIHGNAVPGIEQYADIVDVNNVYPLTFMDQWALTEVTAELSTSCYAGALMLQAMGLGGWMYNGIDPFGIMTRGLGFETSESSGVTPHVIGHRLMHGYCPPYYSDMRAAVDAVVLLKFGPDGPFHPDTPGPWGDTRRIRSAAVVHDERFKQCVALQAQYIYDTFHQFPATVSAMMCTMYLQAQHLDTDYYDHFFKPGAYLASHARHLSEWH